METKKESRRRGILTERNNTKSSARFSTSKRPTFCRTYNRRTAVISKRRIYDIRFILIEKRETEVATNEKSKKQHYLPSLLCISTLYLNFYQTIHHIPLENQTTSSPQILTGKRQIPSSIRHQMNNGVNTRG